MTNSNETKGNNGGSSRAEPLWQKILLLFLDKGFLAGAIVLLGYLVTVNADHLKTVWSTLWSYQEKLFDKRWEAYSELIHHADRVLTEAAVYYAAPHDPTNPLAFDPWPEKIEDLKSRLEHPSIFGRESRWNSLHDVASALSGLVAARAKYALLIPSWLDKSLEDFIRTVHSEADSELARIEGKKQHLTPEEMRDRWSRIRASYFAFKNNLRSAFGLDLRPSGG